MILPKKPTYDKGVYNIFKSSGSEWKAVLIQDSRLQVVEKTKAEAIKSIQQLHKDLQKDNRKYGL